VKVTTRNIDLFDCTYCGLMAEARDHVIPVSYEYASRKCATWDSTEVVPACSECNGLLSSRWMPTIRERAEFIAGRLKARYKKLLSIPDWSEAELKTMGRFLRKGITANLKKRDLVSARIEYAESTALMNISPEDCWDRTPSTYAA
jgi:hypothetical protein